MRVLSTILNIALSLLLLVSTMGVTVHKHHCMGKVRGVAVFKKAKSCLGERNKGRSCPMHCCDDTVEEYKIDNVTKASLEIDLSAKLLPLFTIIASYPEIDFHSSSQLTARYLNYKPPPIDLDIPIQVQSFLL